MARFDPPCPSRVLLLGDLHGNPTDFADAARLAARSGARTIIQLGDFGYTASTPARESFLDEVSATCRRFEVTCLFVDGNHDNHDSLLAIPERTTSGFVPVRDSLFYAPRGLTWSWYGVRFLALGGAPSPDAAWREPGVDWWPSEELSERDVATALAAGHPDVIVSHDCPAGVALDYLVEYPPSQAHRRLLFAVGDTLEPNWWFHGHYHQSHEAELSWSSGSRCRVTGLARAGRSARSSVIVEVAELARPPLPDFDVLSVNS